MGVMQERMWVCKTSMHISGWWFSSIELLLSPRRPVVLFQGPPHIISFARGTGNNLSLPPFGCLFNNLYVAIITV